MPQQQPEFSGQYGGDPQSDDDDWYRNEWPGAWPPSELYSQPSLRRGHDAKSRRTQMRRVTIGLIAVFAALAAAVVVVLVLVRPPSSSTPATSLGGHPPAAGQPVQGSGSRLFVGGTVGKISSTSITISTQAHTITAAITSSTEFTGTAKSASAIKQGDDVSILISGYGSPHPVTNSISDPAGSP